MKNDNPDNAVVNQPTLEEKLEVAEQRRRDTQSAFTKGQMKNKALEAENEKLRHAIATAPVPINVTADEQEELDTLRDENPEAWRQRMNALESKARTDSNDVLVGLTGEARIEAEKSFEIERRVHVLDEFNKGLEGFEITDDLIRNDIPPRILNKMDKGDITFEEFLKEVVQYVTTEKKVLDVKASENPNMNAVGGGHKPSKAHMEKSVVDNYASIVF
jgi:hypothetical protein